MKRVMKKKKATKLIVIAEEDWELFKSISKVQGYSMSEILRDYIVKYNEKFEYLLDEEEEK